MSFTITRLLERYNRLGAATLQDRPEQFFDGAPTPAIGLWRLWAYAESFLRLKDWTRALNWLDACEAIIETRNIEVGQVWLADFATSKGAILYRIRETGQALPYLEKALTTWVELFDRLQIPPEQQPRPLGEEIAEMFEAITPREELDQIQDQYQLQILMWIQERLVARRLEVASDLIGALTAAHAFEKGRQVAEDTFIWLPTSIEPPSQPWFKYALRMALGNLELAAADIPASIREFDRAARLFEGDSRSEAIDRRSTALFNKANSMLRQQKYAEVRKLYRELKGMFAQRGNNEGVRRVRYALLHTDFEENRQAPIEADLRALARDYEEFISEQRDPQNFHVYKENLEQVYRLLLTVLASSTAGLSVALDCLSIIRGLRETYELANLDRPRSLPAAEWLGPMLQNTMPVLAERLTALPSTALVVLESGVNCLIVIAIERIDAGDQGVAVSVIDEEHVAPIILLIEQVQQTSDQLIARIIPAKSSAEDKLVELSQSFWNALTPDVHRMIDGCSTLLYSPSSWGSIDELPLELIHTGENWLGLTKSIARVPSLSALAELLAPNQVPRQFENRAFVLRAEDPPTLDQLESADRVAKTINRAAGILGLESTLDDKPTAGATIEALKNGNRLFHYEGHGMAAELGECLYISPDEVVRIEDLEILRDHTTPFSYLNCCEVGRGRHLQGGKQQGITIGLLAQGAPGVIAAGYAVPDHILGDVALAFYRASSQSHAGAALRDARLDLDRNNYHPIAWASFALHGDPFFAISPKVDEAVQGSREFTLDWPAHLTRYLASEAQEDVQACVDKLRDLNDPNLRAVYDKIQDFIKDETEIETGEKLAQEIVAWCLTGAVALRQLVAMRRVGQLTSTPDPTTGMQDLIRSEIGLGLTLSLRLRDRFAFCAFARLHAKHLTGDVTLTETMQVLRAARQYADGLSSYSDRFSALAKKINEEFSLLDKNVLFDLASVVKSGR